MSCPLTSGYQVPCRQISGVQNIYLAGVDGTFSIVPSFTISNFVISYQDNETNGGDIYVPGTYVLDLRTMSNDDDLYTDINNDINYYLPSWINGSVTVVIGDQPINPDDYQSISISINYTTNNYINTNFYIALTQALQNWIINNNDSVYIGTILQPNTTYQIYNFSKNFYHFTQRLEQASYLENEVYGENGVVAYNQKLEITLEGYNQTIKNIISLLNKSRLRAIIQDYSNNYHLIGYQNYITTTTADGGLGKLLTDGVKTTLTIEGKEPIISYQLDPTVYLSGLLIG